MPDAFSCTVRPEPEWVRLVLAGELDTVTAPQLAGAVAGVRGDGARRILIDLEALDFLDSAGLRVFVVARHDVEGDGGELLFTPGTPEVQRLLAITGFDSIFRFVRPED